MTGHALVPLLALALGSAACSNKPGESRADDPSVVKAKLKADEIQFRRVCDPARGVASVPNDHYAEEWKRLKIKRRSLVVK
jgi:hypothetical protein